MVALMAEKNTKVIIIAFPFHERNHEKTENDKSDT